MMKKKILICLLFVLILFGCSKEEELEENNIPAETKTFSCSKVDKGNYYYDEMTNKIGLTDDNVLVTYTTTDKFKYDTNEKYNDMCSKFKKSYSEEKYNGYEGNVECDSNNKTVLVTDTYSLYNLDSELKKTILWVNDNNVFDLDKWKSEREQDGWKCS